MRSFCDNAFFVLSGFEDDYAISRIKKRFKTCCLVGRIASDSAFDFAFDIRGVHRGRICEGAFQFDTAVGLLACVHNPVNLGNSPVSPAAVLSGAFPEFTLAA